MTELEFACQCGAVRATLHEVSPQKGNHLRCYCRDCQAFMSFCGCEETGLNAHGGSDIYQVRASSVTLTQGREHLAAIRLTGGMLVRWYTTCCKTPMANTPAPGWLDFAGFPVMTLGPEDRRDEAIGPLLGQAFTESARGGPAAVGKTRGILRLFGRVFRMVLSTAFTSPAKRSPFRDPDTGTFLVEPVTLSEAERAAIYAKVDSARLSGG